MSSVGKENGNKLAEAAGANRLGLHYLVVGNLYEGAAASGDADKAAEGLNNAFNHNLLFRAYAAQHLPRLALEKIYWIFEKTHKDDWVLQLHQLLTELISLQFAHVENIGSTGMTYTSGLFCYDRSSVHKSFMTAADAQMSGLESVQLPSSEQRALDETAKNKSMLAFILQNRMLAELQTQLLVPAWRQPNGAFLDETMLSKLSIVKRNALFFAGFRVNRRSVTQKLVLPPAPALSTDVVEKIEEHEKWKDPLTGESLKDRKAALRQRIVGADWSLLETECAVALQNQLYKVHEVMDKLNSVPDESLAGMTGAEGTMKAAALGTPGNSDLFSLHRLVMRATSPERRDEDLQKHHISRTDAGETGAFGASFWRANECVVSNRLAAETNVFPGAGEPMAGRTPSELETVVRLRFPAFGPEFAVGVHALRVRALVKQLVAERDNDLSKMNEKREDEAEQTEEQDTSADDAAAAVGALASETSGKMGKLRVPKLLRTWNEVQAAIQLDIDRLATMSDAHKEGANSELVQNSLHCVERFLSVLSAKLETIAKSDQRADDDTGGDKNGMSDKAAQEVIGSGAGAFWAKVKEHPQFANSGVARQSLLSELAATLHNVLGFVKTQKLHFNCPAVNTLETASFFIWPMVLQKQEFMLKLSGSMGKACHAEPLVSGSVIAFQNIFEKQLSITTKKQFFSETNRLMTAIGNTDDAHLSVEVKQTAALAVKTLLQRLASNRVFLTQQRIDGFRSIADSLTKAGPARNQEKAIALNDKKKMREAIENAAGAGDTNMLDEEKALEDAALATEWREMLPSRYWERVTRDIKNFNAGEKFAMSSANWDLRRSLFAAVGVDVANKLGIKASKDEDDDLDEVDDAAKQNYEAIIYPQRQDRKYATEGADKGKYKFEKLKFKHPYTKHPG